MGWCGIASTVFNDDKYMFSLIVNTVLVAVLMIPAMYVAHLRAANCCIADCWSIASTVFIVDNCMFSCIVNTVLVAMIPATWITICHEAVDWNRLLTDSCCLMMMKSWSTV